MNEWGKWFEAYIQPAIKYLKSRFWTLLALLLLAIGTIVLMLALFYFIKFTEIENAIAVLQGFSTEEEFHNKYEEIDEYFQQRELGPCWGIY